jgi:hypothetical protein
MVKADWKSIQELREDVAAGEPVNPNMMVLDLWERVDELEAKVTDLSRQLAEKNSN